LQVSLLTDFVNHLYGVCVPVRWKFVPDPKYPWMTLEIQDAIRQRDRMRTGTVAFRSAKCQEAASAQFVEKEIDPGLSQRVLWSNFCRLGFCNSSDFSSFGVGVEDSAEYFGNLPVTSVQIPTASDEHLGGFTFRHIDLVECFSAFKSKSTKVLRGSRYLKLLLPLICCHVLHVFNHAITSSVFLSFGQLLRLVHLLVLLTSVLFKAFECILYDQMLEHVRGRNLLSDLQSSFRRGHNTATALVRVTEDLRST
jgi:hypothetical protein